MPLNRARAALTSLIEVTILTLFAAMILSTMAQVVSRYAFNAPLIWSEELSRYLFIWISFLGAWLAWTAREHLGIDILPHVLPPRLKRPFQILIELTVLIFALASMYYGRKILSVSLNQPSAVLRLPMFWIYLSYYTCMILISLDIILSWIAGQRAEPVGVAQ